MNQPKLARKIRYHAYKARKIAERHSKADGFEEDLYDFCARGSAILWEELNRAGLKAEIVYNPGHVFVYCEGWYVDITATQFGLGKTLVRSEATAQRLSEKEFFRKGERLFPDWHKECAWNIFNNPISLQAWQNNNNWVNKNGIVKIEDILSARKMSKPTKIKDIALLSSSDF